MSVLPRGATVRRDAGLYGYERALRRAGLAPIAGVDGLGKPGLAVWKGDRVAACIAAASVIAKVSRDRIMCRLHEHFPQYGFDVHKGYCTREHDATLAEHGPCPEHRRRFINVRTADQAPAEAR